MNEGSAGRGEGRVAGLRENTRERTHAHARARLERTRTRNAIATLAQGASFREGPTRAAAMETESAPERQVKELFGIESDSVVNDVLNAFQDYIADGFDSVEEFTRRSFPPNDSAALKMLLAIEQLHNLMQESAKKAAKKLDTQVKESVFYVPEELIMCAQRSCDKVDREALVEEEANLDRELNTLRANIASTRESCKQYQTDINATATELATYDIDRIQAIPQVLGSGKENFIDNANAVTKAGQELRTLLPRLAELSKSFRGASHRSDSMEFIQHIEAEIEKRKESPTGRSLKEMASLLSMP